MSTLEFVRRRVVPGAIAASALVACSTSGSPPASPAPAGPMPDVVSVAAADVTAGFFTGHLRQPQHVDAFRVAKRPTTVAEYRACVDKGACTAPSSQAAGCRGLVAGGPLGGPTFDRGQGGLPVTCVTIAQARAFCAWVGGALPKPSAWMLAARGADVHRYAWGDAPATCAQRPDTLDDPSGGCAPASDEDPSLFYAVGRHPGGASPSGVEDVLLAPGEILDADDGAQFPACASPRSGCVVRGARAGAIDSFEPIAGGEGDEGVTTTAAFRCVFAEAKQ